jgi:hypothetical protein
VPGGAETPAPGTTTTAPTTAPGGGAPGGTTGGGRPGGITLPDTGSDGSGGNNAWLIAMAALAGVGAAGLAGGLWFSAAAARRRGED